MKIYKPLTRAEEKRNKKYPNKPPLVPYIAFYIDEKKYPEESKLWELLGFDNLRDIVREKNTLKE